MYSLFFTDILVLLPQIIGKTFNEVLEYLIWQKQ